MQTGPRTRKHTRKCVDTLKTQGAGKGSVDKGLPLKCENLSTELQHPRESWVRWRGRGREREKQSKACKRNPATWSPAWTAAAKKTSEPKNAGKGHSVVWLCSAYERVRVILQDAECGYHSLKLCFWHRPGYAKGRVSLQILAGYLPPMEQAGVGGATSTKRGRSC